MCRRAARNVSRESTSGSGTCPAASRTLSCRSTKRYKQSAASSLVNDSVSPYIFTPISIDLHGLTTEHPQIEGDLPCESSALVTWAASLARSWRMSASGMPKWAAERGHVPFREKVRVPPQALGVPLGGRYASPVFRSNMRGLELAPAAGRRDDHVHLPMKLLQDGHQPVGRESGELCVADAREVGRGGSSQLLRRASGQAFGVQRLDDLGGQARPQLAHVRVGHSEIGEHVAAAPHQFEFVVFHASASFSRLMRSRTRSISCLGVAIPLVDFFWKA